MFIIRLKRFITDDEFEKLTELSKKKELISPEPYTSVNRSDDTTYISNILKEVIVGFYKFSAFTKGDRVRIKYNWNYDDTTKSSFEGVGYVKLIELKNGFEN